LAQGVILGDILAAAQSEAMEPSTLANGVYLKGQQLDKPSPCLSHMPPVQLAPPMLSGINVIIPMGGGSEDFSKAGYRFPKPLVSIVGRPMVCWLLDALKLQPVDSVFLALPRQMEAEQAIERRLRDEYPSVDFRFVLLEFATRGAAETLFIVLQHLSPQELTRRTISLDCDNIYLADVLSQFRSLPAGLSATWFFDDEGEQALYSYITLDDQPPGSNVIDQTHSEASGIVSTAVLPGGKSCEATCHSVSRFDFVREVREKLAISCHANVGVYGFASGAQLRAHCESIMDIGPPTVPTPTAKASSQMDRANPSVLFAPSLRNDGAPPSPEMAAAVAATVATKAELAHKVFEAVGGTTAETERTPESHASPAFPHGDAREAGGWYISAVMRDMLHHGAPIVGLRLIICEDFIDLGTPNHLQAFLWRLRNGEARLHSNRRMRFIFDLDGTLVTPPRKRGDYASVEPIAQNIVLLQSLKAAGHYIIIWTSRESERQKGNIGAIVAAVGKVTLSTLDRYDIPYDELIFGKPHADAYIDHRAINSTVDTEKELGWAATASTHDATKKIDGGIAARAFNTVRPLDELHVVKTGPCHVMRGELHWYRHVPSELADLFPKPVEISDGGKHMASIVMTKVEGVPFTHLLVNLCLTPTRLLRLLNALTRVHRCTKSMSCAEQAGSATLGSLPIPVRGLECTATFQQGPACEDTLVLDMMLYVNLRPKVIERYEKFKSLYHSFSVSDLGFNIEELVQPLLTALAQYEDGRRACRAEYIHGDPVFSNVLLASGGSVWLLDMRGALGDKLTTNGDVTYDLSKVYQSLCGYDFFLQDRDLTSSGQAHLETLQRVFWQYVSSRYPEVSLSDVRLLTAQHFFAIVPLHEVRARMRLYLRMAHALLVGEGMADVGTLGK